MRTTLKTTIRIAIAISGYFVLSGASAADSGIRECRSWNEVTVSVTSAATFEPGDSAHEEACSIYNGHETAYRHSRHLRARITLVERPENPGAVSWYSHAVLSPAFDSSHVREQANEISIDVATPLREGGTIFGYVGMPGKPAYGASVYRHALIEDTYRADADRHWLDPDGSSDEVITAGYKWRNMKLEGSAYSEHRSRSDIDAGRVFRPFGLRSGRLSMKPTKNWAVQISRKQSSRLDDINTAEARRTTISAVYDRDVGTVEWKTTLAVARGAREDETVVSRAALLESVFTMNRAHSFFVRMERAGADELFTEDEALRGQGFGVRKMTFGYVYDVPFSRSSRLGVGAVASRSTAASENLSLLGDNRSSYKVFARVMVPY